MSHTNKTSSALFARSAGRSNDISQMEHTFIKKFQGSSPDSLVVRLEFQGEIINLSADSQNKHLDRRPIDVRPALFFGFAPSLRHNDLSPARRSHWLSSELKIWTVPFLIRIYKTSEMQIQMTTSERLARGSGAFRPILPAWRALGHLFGQSKVGHNQQGGSLETFKSLVCRSRP